MGQIGTLGLTEKAVLWQMGVGNADAYGRERVGPETEIDCRWEEDKNLSRSGNASTEQVVATVDVDRAIAVGSRMWRGKKVDRPPAFNGTLRKVVSYHEVNDVKGIETRRWVTLAKVNDTLPGAL